MEILIVLGIIGGACGIASLATMPKERQDDLFKTLEGIATLFILLMVLIMIGLAILCTWMLIDEKSAVTFFTHGAITEPIFTGDSVWLKWWVCLPMPFAIPWMIYRIVSICKEAN